MITGVHVDNFRGINDLRIEGLRRINLFVGANNVGKTSLLEALWLLSAPGMPALTLNLAQFRGEIPVTGTPSVAAATVVQGWRGLFGAMNGSRDAMLEAEIAGTWHRLQMQLSLDSPVAFPLVSASTAKTPDSNTNVSLSGAFGTERLGYRYARGDDPPANTFIEISGEQLQMQQSPQLTFVRSVFLGTRTLLSEQEIAEQLSQIEERGTTAEVVSALQVYEPDLKALSVAVVGQRPIIRGLLATGRVMPLSLLGDGVVNMTRILLSVSTIQNGLALIDEFENGTYFANLEPAWRALDRASVSSGSQIMATTHSRECLIAAVNTVGAADPEALAVYRLERHRGEHRVVRYDAAVAREALDANYEVR